MKKKYANGRFEIIIGGGMKLMDIKATDFRGVINFLKRNRVLSCFNIYKDMTCFGGVNYLQIVYKEKIGSGVYRIAKDYEFSFDGQNIVEVEKPKYI